MKAVILNDTSRENHHGCSRVMDNLYSKLGEYNIQTSAIGYLRDDLESPALIENINNCDFAIINGEGTIHHNNPYAENLLKLVAESTARKKILINATYDSNPAYYNTYLDQFDHIFVRDGQSEAELRSCSIASSVAPDLTFLSHPDASARRRSGIFVVDSVDRSTLIHLFSLQRKNRYLRPLSIFRKNTSIVERLHDVRKSVALTDFLSPLFMAKAISARRWFNSHACDDHSVFSNEIAQCDFLISGRYHAVCMAIKNLTPFLAIESNTFKISALLSDIGLVDRCLIKENFLATGTLSMNPFSAAEIDLIRKYDKDARRRINDMFEMIFEHG